MSDYNDGWNDGYKYAREEIIEKLREIPVGEIDSCTAVAVRMFNVCMGGSWPAKLESRYSSNDFSRFCFE